MKTCEIRNNPGMSSYFQGKHQGYGRYQWNIKFYGFESDFEIEMSQQWAFGSYMHSKQQFDQINEVIGRPVKAGIGGRSGGWFVIYDELTEEELKKLDKYVEKVIKNLPEYLKEERELKVIGENEHLELELKTKTELLNNKKIKKTIELLKEVAGQDLVLCVKGIKLV